MAAATGAQTLKNEILSRLRAIRSRSSSYSFRFVQAALKEAGMPSATGWLPLLNKYESLDYAGSGTDWSAWLMALDELHKHSYLVGSTAVWTFEAPEEDIRAILANPEKLFDRDSPFFAPFPFPVAEDVLETQPFEVKLVAARDLGRGDVAIIGCGRRAYREREQYDASDLDDTFEILGRFEEIIVVRAGWTQAFDRWVLRPRSKRVELHVDLCCPLNADELETLQAKHVDLMKARVKKATGLTLDWLNKPRNLFPYIRKLYNAKDGLVLALGHATGTKSIKEERMRGQRLDLRDELFHKHGIKAIKGTEAYSIKKGWPVSSGKNVPSVYIPGHFSNAGAPNAAVRRAVIENCASLSDFELVIKKLT